LGYDLHITRKNHWTDEGPDISADEWKAILVDEPGLSERFDFRDGRIVVKNPDQATIAKMVAIAESLGARVQGDDGELYGSAEQPPPPPATPSLRGRLRAWISALSPRAAAEPVSLPFGVGDRVRNTLGHVGTVLAVDVRANRGLGSVRVKYDDGRELSYSALAHDLSRD
jgi:hypothetical protein